MTKIVLELTLNQSNAICDGLDAYARLCIGQLDEVSNLVRTGVIPMAQLNSSNPRVQASVEICDRIESLMNEAKIALGYSVNGSHGIGHQHVHITGRRAYEVNKVLSKVAAESRDPNPQFKGVNYDGLGPRYTTDPAPLAYIKEAA